MNTDRDARLRIYESLLSGEPPTTQEVEALLEDAAEGERAAEKLEQLEQALAQMGYALVDVTTDDDEGEVLELVQVHEDQEG